MANQNIACTRLEFAPVPPTPRRSWFGWIGLAYDRYRQRQLLAELDDAALRDIGLTPADVRRECDKPFWR